MLWLIYHWRGLEIFAPIKKYPKISFSIVIPYRNEEKVLEECLLSVLNQNYPHQCVEIITINDHSEDQSENIVKNIVAKNPTLKGCDLEVKNGKKEAIEKGVSLATHPWIVTLDADCVVGDHWLEKLNQYIQMSQKKYVVMPVVYHREKNFFEKIQSLEFLSLVASSAACIQGGMPLMSNGANAAFSKEVFNAVNGFEGNKHISSGDDVFLLQKIYSLDKKAVGYLHHREVIAATYPVFSLGDFIEQRVRWGSKTKAYTSAFAVLVASIVFLVNIEILALGVLALMKGVSWMVFLAVFLVKFLFDYLFLRISTPFYGKENLAFLVPVLAILYPIYIFVISLMSFVYRPDWKGRKIITDK